MRSCSDLAYLRRILGISRAIPSHELQVTRQPLAGGLEAASVTRVQVRYRDRTGRCRAAAVVVKELRSPAVREATVYADVLQPGFEALAPRLLGVRRPGPGRMVLYLAAVRPVCRWPWSNPLMAQRVLERVALLHSHRPRMAALCALTAWNYEDALQDSAELTLARLEHLPGDSHHRDLRRGIRPLRNIILALRRIRRALLGCKEFQPGVIHGDLHSGNVLLRRLDGREEPVLLDWARARLGSPWEDVSSWLQSLGFWEPEARRRHDTLLMGYLAARNSPATLGPDLRATYWIAAASNGLAGALAHHLATVRNPLVNPRWRVRAFRAAMDWIRVVRRAEAYWG